MLALINMHASINIHACIQHVSLNMNACVNQHACIIQHMHETINMHQLISPDNDNNFITIIAISVAIAVKCAYNTAAYIVQNSE